MEAIYNSGRCRAIGVSNFQIEHLRRLDAETAIVPAVNQIEVHPYLSQAELRAYDARHGIATEAWSPLAQGEVLGDPVIGAIAARVGRTPAQVVLRWHIQRGDIVFPKSVTPERVRENFDIFDFVLSDDDIEAISGLNRDQRTGPDPDVFDYVPS
jgi:2,5-diketo-D-gluconate reductase A